MAINTQTYRTSYELDIKVAGQASPQLKVIGNDADTMGKNLRNATGHLKNFRQSFNKLSTSTPLVSIVSGFVTQLQLNERKYKAFANKIKAINKEATDSQISQAFRLHNKRESLRAKELAKESARARNLGSSGGGSGGSGGGSGGSGGGSRGSGGGSGGSGGGSKGLGDGGFGSRGLMDSVGIVAKYGLISQALFGIQNAIGGIANEIISSNDALYQNMAILNMTKAESKSLISTVHELGSTYGGQISEIQQGVITLGRQGINDLQELKEAAKVAKELSLITGDTMTSGANVMSSMMNVYQLTSDEVKNLGDQLGYVANETRLGLDDFSTISNYALSAVSALGITKESYLALAGSLSKVGFAASTTGTSIRRFQKLVTDKSAMTGNFFRVLGISQDDFATGLRDDSGVALKEFIGQLGAMDDVRYKAASGSLPTLIKQLTDGLRAGTVAGADYFNQIQDALDGTSDKMGTIEGQAETMAEGVTVTFQGLSNSVMAWFEELVSIDSVLKSIISTGKQFGLRTGTRAPDGVTEATAEYNRLVEKQKNQHIVTTVGGVFGVSDADVRKAKNNMEYQISQANFVKTRIAREKALEVIRKKELKDALALKAIKAREVKDKIDDSLPILKHVDTDRDIKLIEDTRRIQGVLNGTLTETSLLESDILLKTKQIAKFRKEEKDSDNRVDRASVIYKLENERAKLETRLSQIRTKGGEKDTKSSGKLKTTLGGLREQLKLVKALNIQEELTTKLSAGFFGVGTDKTKELAINAKKEELSAGFFGVGTDKTKEELSAGFFGVGTDKTKELAINAKKKELRVQKAITKELAKATQTTKAQLALTISTNNEKRITVALVKLEKSIGEIILDQLKDTLKAHGATAIKAGLSGNTQDMDTAVTGLLSSGIDALKTNPSTAVIGYSIDALSSLFSSSVTQEEIDATIGRVDYTDDSLNSLRDILSDVQYPMLQQSLQMNTHLKAMDDNFVQIATALTGSTSGIDVSGSEFVETKKRSFSGFSTESSNLIASGLKFELQTLGDVMDDSALKVQRYQYTLVEKSSWWGIVKNEDITKSMKNLPPKLVKEFADSFSSGYELLLTSGVALGLQEADLAKALAAAEISMSKVELKGLSPEEITDRLSKAFSTAFSGVVDQIPELSKLAEQYAEGIEDATLAIVRITKEFVQASYQLSLIGKDITDTYSTVEYDDGSVEAFNARMVAIMKGHSLTEGYLAPTKQEKYSAVEQTLDIQQGAGGADAFNTSMAALVSGFYSAEEQLAQKKQYITDAFGALDITTIPKTRDEFRRLLETMDTADKKGAKLYGQVLSLSTAFTQATESSEELKANLKEIKELEDREMQAKLDAAKRYQGILNGILKERVGSLSYLTSQQKVDVSQSYYDSIKGQQGASDIARLVAESSMGTTATKADYIPIFEQYIAAKKKEEVDASNADLLDELKAIKDELVEIQEATYNTSINT